MCANMIVCCIGGKMWSWTDVKDATRVGTRSKKRIFSSSQNIIFAPGPQVGYSFCTPQNFNIRNTILGKV